MQATRRLWAGLGLQSRIGRRAQSPGTLSWRFGRAAGMVEAATSASTRAGRLRCRSRAMPRPRGPMGVVVGQVRSAAQAAPFGALTDVGSVRDGFPEGVRGQWSERNAVGPGCCLGDRRGGG
jgi:hypothetical protein